MVEVILILSHPLISPQDMSAGGDIIEGWFILELKVAADIGLVEAFQMRKIYFTFCSFSCKPEIAVIHLLP